MLFIAPGAPALRGAGGGRDRPHHADPGARRDLFGCAARHPSPYLIWFVRAQLWDGLERPNGDLLTAVAHRADREEVAVRPTEVLAAFDPPADEGAEIDAAAMRQGQGDVGRAEEIVEAGVRLSFLPALADRRASGPRPWPASGTRWSTGLDALVEQLSQAAMQAYTEGDMDAGVELTAQKDAVAGSQGAPGGGVARGPRILLLTEPEVLSVALVLPAPLEVEITDETGTQTVADAPR